MIVSYVFTLNYKCYFEARQHLRWFSVTRVWKKNTLFYVGRKFKKLFPHGGKEFRFTYSTQAITCVNARSQKLADVFQFEMKEKNCPITNVKWIDCVMKMQSLSVNLWQHYKTYLWKCCRPQTVSRWRIMQSSKLIRDNKEDMYKRYKKMSFICQNIENIEKKC